MIKIGMGKDIHRLIAGRPFLLGGIRIPHEKGEDGYSDGDVLVHAVIDAILGASGLGDIGEMFPTGDPKWKNADSMELLKRAWELTRGQGWRIVNIDCVVTCEIPKILPYREAIRKSIAAVLGADEKMIFVKGKTAEGLDAVGRNEAVEAIAVCLLESE